MQENGPSSEAPRSEGAIFKHLQTVCCSPGFIHAVAYFCWRDNFIIFSGKHVTERDTTHQYSHDKLLRTEISTLVGLMSKSEIDVRIPNPNVLNRYICQSEELLREMHMSLQEPWKAAIQAMAINRGKSDRTHPLGKAAGLREPIFYAGESAYNFQYGELSLMKYQNDNGWLLSNFGFSIDEACLVANKLRDLQTQKMRDLREPMRRTHPSQRTFLPAFVFDIQELARIARLPTEKIKNVIAAFTFNRRTANESFSSLSSFNETNAAPIIELNDNSYVLLQHYSLLEALYEAPFFWMTADNSYAATASKHRGEFAERFVANRLANVFGSKYVFQNVHIKNGKQRIAEVDVLVIFGNRAIVVQTKSKRLTIEARKGNDRQLKDDFKKAIQDAYDQSILCSQALLQDDYKFVLESGVEIELPARRPSKIFPVCAVSDHYPALAAQAGQFLITEVTEYLSSPLITDIFFLDVLTEILNTPIQFMNYITLRAYVYKKLVVNQELTVLAFHLRHNLWFDDEYDWVHLQDDFTSSLDIAMSARRLGVPGNKIPKGILTRFHGTPIGRLIAEFEASGTPEFVGIGMMLLRIGSESANHINHAIDRLVSSAARDGRPHDLSVPLTAEKSGFTIHVSAIPEVLARSRLSAHCRMRKYDGKADSWYGLLLTPGTGAIRGAFAIEEKWRPDAVQEKLLEAFPKKPLVPISTISEDARRRKVGRNDPCPCGSGRKYKKCCI